jgi:hypothetical protein
LIKLKNIQKLIHNPPFGLLDKRDDLLYFLDGLETGLDLFQGLGYTETRTVYKAVNLLQQVNGLVAETAAPKSNHIQSIVFEWFSGHQYKRWYILNTAVAPSDKGVFADMGKLMNPNHGSDIGPVIYGHMAPELDVVGEYGVVSHLAVMSHMGVGHEQAI